MAFDHWKWWKLWFHAYWITLACCRGHESCLCNDMCDWLRCGWKDVLPGRALLLRGDHDISISSGWPLPRTVTLETKICLTASSSRQFSGLVKSWLASSSSLWKVPSVRTCAMISVFELLSSNLYNFTVGIYFPDYLLCVHRHPRLLYRHWVQQEQHSQDSVNNNEN